MRSTRNEVDQWQRITSDSQYFEVTREGSDTFVEIKPQLDLETNDEQQSNKGIRIARPTSTGVYIKDKNQY